MDKKVESEALVENLLLRPAEAGRLLAISRAKVYLMCAKGELPVVRVGKAVRISLAGLRAWVSRQMERNEGSDGRGAQ